MTNEARSSADWIFPGAYVRVVRDEIASSADPWTGRIVRVEWCYGDYVECSWRCPSRRELRRRMYTRSMLEAVSRDDKAEQVLRGAIDPDLRICGVLEAMPSGQEVGAVVLRVDVRVPAALIDDPCNEQPSSCGDASMKHKTTLILRCPRCAAEHEAPRSYPDPPDVPGMLLQNTEIGQNCPSCGRYGYHKLIGALPGLVGDKAIIAKHAGTIAELRSEAKALYASLRATVSRLNDHESTEAAERELAKYRQVLTRLGAL